MLVFPNYAKNYASTIDKGLATITSQVSIIVSY